jgi:hypothetical protein
LNIFSRLPQNRGRTLKFKQILNFVKNKGQQPENISDFISPKRIIVVPSEA